MAGLGGKSLDVCITPFQTENIGWNSGGKSNYLPLSQDYRESEV